MANTNTRGGIKLENFLTPESMITPGIAGSVVMTITNVLTATFLWQAAWIALVLSFVVGLLALRSDQGVITKFVFYVLNSLVIFSVAFGTNTAGLAVKGETPVAAFAIIGPAMAQGPDLDALKTRIAELGTQFDNLTAQIDAARNGNAPATEIDALVAEQKSIDDERSALITRLVNGATADTPQQTQGQFFKPWRF